VSKPAVPALSTATVANPAACDVCNCPVGQPTCDACFGVGAPCRCTVAPGVTPAGSGTVSCLVVPSGINAGGITYDSEALNVIVSCPTGGVPLGATGAGVSDPPACTPTAGAAVPTLTKTGAQCALTGFVAGSTVSISAIECVYITAA
jgi:hypothetical protein